MQARRAPFRDFFRFDKIDALCASPLERRANLGYHLWGLMTLFLWMKKWRIQRRPLEEAARIPEQVFSSYLIVLLFAAAVYAGCMISPPSLMDDVDAVQAQIARNMLTSGDWVTARLDGIAYLEKAPLIYWLMAISFKIFGPCGLGRAHSRCALRLGASRGSRPHSGSGRSGNALDFTPDCAFPLASDCFCSREF